MKKSTLVTLIVSILLIVLGFVLVALGISSSYDSFEYRVGRAVYFQMLEQNPSESEILMAELYCWVSLEEHSAFKSVDI